MVYLQTTYELRFWGSVFSCENTNIDVSVFMIDLKMINMSSECEYDWYWKNISLLNTIWSLWRVHFAHSPTNFIFWLGRLICSVSINSHPDNIYICSTSCFYFISYWWNIIFLIIRISTCQFLGLFTEINISNLIKLIFCDYLRV